MVRPQRGRKREGDSSVGLKKGMGGQNNGSKRTNFSQAEPDRKNQHERKDQLRMPGDLASNLILVLTIHICSCISTPDALGLNLQQSSEAS